MYKVKFRFDLKENRRLMISEEKLDFKFEDKECYLKSALNNNINMSKELEIHCKEFGTKESADEFKYIVESWLSVFSFKANTGITLPKNNYRILKIPKDNEISAVFELSSSMSYHTGLFKDKEIFLESIEHQSVASEFEIINFGIFNLSTNVSEGYKIILLTTILENIAEKLVDDTKESKEVIDGISSLITHLESLKLKKKSKEVIEIKLNNIRNKSIRSKIREAVEQLIPDKTYCDLRAVEFVNEMYTIRSKMSHEGRIFITKKLKREKFSINKIIGEYNRFVRDCLTAYLK